MTLKLVAAKNIICDFQKIILLQFRHFSVGGSVKQDFKLVWPYRYVNLVIERPVYRGCL